MGIHPPPHPYHKGNLPTPSKRGPPLPLKQGDIPPVMLVKGDGGGGGKGGSRCICPYLNTLSTTYNIQYIIHIYAVGKPQKKSYP